MQRDGYSAKAHTFLTQARDELAKGDSAQASEKLWGASAQMVKAAAQSRGWPHRTHADLFKVVDRLSQEAGDPELRPLFQVATGLHTNFYENWQSLEFVGGCLPRIEELITKLEGL